MYIDTLFAIPSANWNMIVHYTEAHLSPWTIMRYVCAVSHSFGCIETSGFREGLY